MQDLHIEIARHAPVARSGTGARLHEPAKEDLQQVLETADVGLTRCSKDLRYLSANPAYARIAGLPVELIAGRPIVEVMGSAAFETIRPYVERVLRGGRVEYEAEVAFSSSGSRYLHVVYTPWRLRSGEIGGWVASVSDITESKRARELQQEVLNIAMLEQRRIGQELHDGIQQELTGLGLLAQTLSDMIGVHGDTGTAVQLANRVADGIAKANAHVRELAHGLMPVPVDSGSLAAALDALANDVRDSSGLECRFECSGPAAFSDSDAATHLFRLAQEAVGNALKHARANTLAIRIRQANGQWTLEIADDGVGFDSSGPPGLGSGLRIMQHRCALAGGVLSVNSRAGAGTVVTCAIRSKPMMS